MGELAVRVGRPSEPTGIPSKSIIMWPLPFDKDLFPQLNGYILCDGTNGTPDLQGYFVRGVPIGGDVILPTWGGPECASAIVGCDTHCHSIAIVSSTVKICYGLGALEDNPIETITTPFDSAVGSSLPKAKQVNYIMKL